MPKNYQIELPAFNGPLDLLLHLIERHELDITAISLVKVTEQYLAQIEQMKQERMEELMDFLGDWGAAGADQESGVVAANTGVSGR